MKSLSSLERIVLECVGNRPCTYEGVLFQTGLRENVCFNILQALIIRGLTVFEDGYYKIKKELSPLILEEINGREAKIAESLENIEAVIEQRSDRVFRYQKIAMDEKDEKIFLAMLSNIESFLAESHKKAQMNTALKDRKIVFWGMGEVGKLMNHLVMEK
jgi:hypothetical protein